MPPFEPKRGSIRMFGGWLTLGHKTNLPSSEESRLRQAAKRQRRARRLARGRRAHGRQIR